MTTLLVFVPNRLHQERPGYLIGRVVHDENRNTKKFYILRSVSKDYLSSTKNDVIGYFSSFESQCEHPNQSTCNWINVHLDESSSLKPNYNYCLGNIYMNNEKTVPTSLGSILIVVYDQNSFMKTELFNGSTHGDHFAELKSILQLEPIRNEIQGKSKLQQLRETMLAFFMLVLSYPVLHCYKVMSFMRQILKYSMLGTHLGSWFQNLVWITSTVAENKRVTLKTGNLMVTMVLDVLMGIFVLKILLYYIRDEAPSELLLVNAEASWHEKRN